MKFLVLSSIIYLASARLIENEIERCDGVILNGINHEKEVLKDYVDKPYMMSIDYDTNVLYFTFTGHGGSIFQPALINLKTKEYQEISGVDGGFATSVDPKTHKIYIGGDGLFEYDYQTKTATNLHITNQNIWQVFAKNGIYFTTYPNESAFVYKNGKLDKVSAIGDNKAMLLGLDKQDNIFFYNASGLFVHKNNERHTEHVGDYTVNAFTTDSNGNLYFSTPMGVFAIKEDLTIKKMATITNIYGIAIESDGTVICAAQNSVVRLKSTGQKCSEIY